MKYIFAILSLIIIEANACQCDETIDDLYKSSEVVFVANMLSRDENIAEFELIEHFKGPKPLQSELRVSVGIGYSCDVNKSTAVRYILFIDNSNKLTVNMCSAWPLERYKLKGSDIEFGPSAEEVEGMMQKLKKLKLNDESKKDFHAYLILKRYVNN
ncbi:hypothetical protein [Pleionea litopenaei]|uniref:Uncharacterized protein n=1 Tax=Pleionea litopenaei TaxID=3070815 RepID=A0AA51RVG0_9GAMM|nr:hypothetical protein [Pleionea sp. HL-JVS1]WMS88381.1 hypothetical protein Q9312_05565 [Pleionea sp. HL-JVS1]